MQLIQDGERKIHIHFEIRGVKVQGQNQKRNSQSDKPSVRPFLNF